MHGCPPATGLSKAWHSPCSATHIPLGKLGVTPQHQAQTSRVHVGPARRCCGGKFHSVSSAPRHLQAVGSHTASIAPEEDVKPLPLLTVAAARDIAAARGLTLAVREVGPLYQITCRDGGEEGRIVGVSSGFTAAPLGLMHCDSLQVFTDRLEGRDAKSAKERGVGLGLLISGAVIAYGAERGCRTAEILAINDDDAIHARLCKYYRRMGFRVVREVGGNGLSDLPHQLVWGGVGTRMDADTTVFLRRWSNSIRSRK